MKEKKNLTLSLCLAVLFAVAIMVVPTSAQILQMADSLGVDDASGSPGAYVEVPVNIENVKNGPINTIEFRIEYNESVINLTGVTTSDLTTNWDCSLPEKDHVKLSQLMTAGSMISNGTSGSVAMLNFSVVGTYGDSSPMNLTEIYMLNANGDKGTAPAKNGTFRILLPQMADSLGVNDASGSPGDYVEVPVNIENAKNGPISTIEFRIEYNESVINLTGVTTSDLTTNWDCSLPEKDHVKLSQLMTAGSMISNGTSGSVAMLNFSVVGTYGDSSPMNLTEIYMLNANGDKGTAPAKNGTFTILKLTTITVLPPTATLYVDDTQEFTATATDQNGNPVADIGITWTSSDTTVGTVSPASSTTDANGNATTTFTASTVGTSIVKAENETTGIYDTATVTVKSAPAPAGPAVPRAPPAGVTPIETTPTGEVKSTVTAPSADEKATAKVSAGIIAKDAVGNPLEQVEIKPPAKIPAAAPPKIKSIDYKYAYDFGPTGATFSEPVTVSITFDPADIPADYKPVIYTYEADEWKALPTDIVDNTAKTTVTHFSVFALFAEKVKPPVKKVAEFKLTDLTLTPTEITVDENTTITATVKNVGDASGTNTTTVTVAGELVHSEDVTLDPDESTDVTCTYTGTEKGNFTVTAEVDGKKLTETLTVKPKPAPGFLVIGAIASLAIAYVLLRKRK